MEKRLARIILAGAYGAALCISLAFNLLQARKLTSLAERSSLVTQTSPQPAGDLAVGATVPPIVAHSLDGTMRTIAFSQNSKPTVVYIMSPECVWCMRNEDAIRALAQRSVGYRFIAISLVSEGLDQYASRHHLPIEIVKDPSDSTKLAYRLQSTPTTIVVSPKGIVLRSWSGAYLGLNKLGIEKFFSVKLDDIS